MNFQKMVQVLNDLVSAGIVENYAIGGATALSQFFPPELVRTKDVDVFVFLPGTGLLISLTPLYDELNRRGFPQRGEYVYIYDVPVQFLVPPDPLTEEAYTSAQHKEFEGTLTRLFQPEYLVALMVALKRPKDKQRIAMIQEYPPVKWDQDKFLTILDEHSLMDSWRKLTGLPS